jgi:hypothetical protein
MIDDSNDHLINCQTRSTEREVIIAGWETEADLWEGNRCTRCLI